MAMSSYLLFLLLGLGSGAVYAILGLGLVLQYRSAGVVNFAHGATAMFIAYVYVDLRSTGELVFPWVVAPHSVTLSANGLGVGPAMAIALTYAAVLGLVLYLIIFRPLRGAPPLAKVGASVGLMLALQAVAVLNFGTQTRSTPPILPVGSVTVAGARVPTDRIWLAALTLVLAVGLAVAYRFSRFGLATRACAENEKGAALLGLSAARLGAVNWVLATVLAGAAGVLIVPIVSLNPASYTLFIVPALGIVLLARFQSFSITVAAGLLLGMLQSALTGLQTVWPSLPQQGLQQGLVFMVIVAAMLLMGRGVPARGNLKEGRDPAVGLPRHPLRTAVVSLGVGVLAVLVLHGADRAGLITSFIFISIYLSVVIVTGYLGQISLAQMSFAGVGGFGLSHLASGAGIGFPVGLLLAGCAAVPIGLLVGSTALRIRGVNLAIVTLAAAATLDTLIFSNGWFSGGFSGVSVAAPRLFGYDLGITGGSPHDYPRAVFGILVLIIAVALGLLTAALRRSPAGLTFVAVRSNERAAASIGIDSARSKLLAFAIATFVAGIGGALLAYQQSTLSPDSFSVFTSLNVLAIAYVGGVGRIAGAVVAGLMLAPAGLLVTAVGDRLNLGRYQLLIAGIGLIAMSVAHPDGLVSDTARAGVLQRTARLLQRGGRAGGEAPAQRSDAMAAKP